MSVLNLMTDKKSVTIPKALIKALGLDEALLLTTLVNEYEHWKSEGKAENGWVFPTAYDLERNLHFCWRKQWALLDRLEALDLITVTAKRAGRRRIASTRKIKINEETIRNIFMWNEE